MDIDDTDPTFPQLPSVGGATIPAVASPPLAPAVFGLIVPGCPVRSDFLPAVDGAAAAAKFALALTCPGDIAAPLLAVTELVVFAATTIPLDLGVLCYWQIAASNSNATAAAASTGFALLGALTAAKPSAVFPTGWSENEQLIELLQTSSSLILTIGLSLEPVSNLQNLGACPNGSDHKLFVAQKIAADLFCFMQSFDTTGGAGGHMVVPTNIFDRWYQRFENRFRRDPNFFLKAASD